MSEHDEYPPGVPCWVDTWQPDPEAAVGLLHSAGRAYYGTSYERLARVKARYDPGEFFSFRQSLSS